MGRTEKFVRALHLVYYHLPAAVIDQSEQDIAYLPSWLTQFFNLDPPSRRADCACPTASLCQRDRLPSTHTTGSDLRVRGSTRGSTDFWLHTPIRPLLSFTPLSIGGKEHPNESMTLLHSSGSPREWNQDYDNEKRNAPLVSYLIMVLVLWTERAYEESGSSRIPK